MPLSSQGTEKLGGQAVGDELQPGDRCVRGGEHLLHQPADVTRQCLLPNAAYDLSQGHGLVPDRDHDPARRAGGRQTATVKVAQDDQGQGQDRAAEEGRGHQRRQTGHRETELVDEEAKGPRKKFASVKISKTGKVAIRTTGKAKRLYVKLTLTAPAMPGYQAYSYTKKWTVK